MRDRARAMLERVRTEARAAVGAVDADTIAAALETALRARDRAIDDDHDPRYLHPARTIRIAIADGPCTNTGALAAGAFIDTVDAWLVPEPPAPLKPWVDAVPVAGADRDLLLERIITADPDAAVIALAERLDQVRHVHLRHDRDARAAHAEVRAICIPAARRVSAVIARRFEHWADAFERKLILPR